MAVLKVAIVSTLRQVWEGEASLIVLRTLDGEIGIMPGHSPMMAMLDDGPLLLRPTEGDEMRLFVNEGYATVDADRVIVLADTVELASEIDVKQVESDLAAARGSGDQERVRQSEGLLRVALGHPHHGGH